MGEHLVDDIQCQEVLSYDHNPNSQPSYNYSLNSHILQTVTQEKYLGITISIDLNWSTDIDTITNKPNSKAVFTLLFRNSDPT